MDATTHTAEAVRIRPASTAPERRWQAACACGWKGPEQYLQDSAEADARWHPMEKLVEALSKPCSCSRDCDEERKAGAAAIRELLDEF